jgi:hypothetical protein
MSLSAGTVMAVFLMAVIVLGYVAIWAIWHFFFRAAGDHATGERPATVPQKPDDLRIREPHSSADRPCDSSARGVPQATRASWARNDAPADGSDVPRVARHSASSSEDDRQA